MADELKKTTLHNTDPGRNKFYIVEVVPQEPGYGVVVYWGKIGANPMSQRKQSNVSYWKALSAMDDLISAKQKKGYRLVKTEAVESAPRKADSIRSATSGIAAQLDTMIVCGGRRIRFDDD